MLYVRAMKAKFLLPLYTAFVEHNNSESKEFLKVYNKIQYIISN